MLQCINRWLSVRLELLGISVVFGTAVLVAVAAPRSAGLAGLALTSALNLTGLMNWMVRQTTELEVRWGGGRVAFQPVPYCSATAHQTAVRAWLLLPQYCRYRQFLRLPFGWRLAENRCLLHPCLPGLACR